MNRTRPFCDRLEKREGVLVDLRSAVVPTGGPACHNHQDRRASFKGGEDAADGVGHALIGDDQGDADFPRDPAVAIGGGDGRGFVAPRDDCEVVAVEGIEKKRVRRAGQ